MTRVPVAMLVVLLLLPWTACAADPPRPAASANPYNYNGIGYDGAPCAASGRVWIFNAHTRTWLAGPALAVPSMDHRGLLKLGDGRFAVVGGMVDPQMVSPAVAIVAPR